MLSSNLLANNVDSRTGYVIRVLITSDTARLSKSFSDRVSIAMELDLREVG